MLVCLMGEGEIMIFWVEKVVFLKELVSGDLV